MLKMIFIGLGAFGLWAIFLLVGLFQTPALHIAGNGVSWAFLVSGVVGLVAWLKL